MSDTATLPVGAEPAADDAPAPLLSPTGADSHPWDCPVCGAVSDQGPETGDWGHHLHCWSCGYNGAAPSTGTLPTFGPATGSAGVKIFAEKVAEEIRTQLGLPAGTNLMDLLSQVGQARQPEAVPVAGSVAPGNTVAGSGA